jgi:hypothetical protein
MTSGKLRREQQIRIVCKYIDTHLDLELKVGRAKPIAMTRWISLTPMYQCFHFNLSNQQQFDERPYLTGFDTL